MRRKNQSSEFIKQCIALALVKLMREKHLNDISITEICEKSGYGRTTYYRHFSKDKEALILYLAEAYWMKTVEDHKEEYNKNEANLFLTCLYEHRDFFLILEKQGLYSLVYRMIHAIFGIKKDDDQMLRYGKAMLVGIIFGTTNEWMRSGCVDTPQEIERKMSFAMDILKRTQEGESRGN